MRRDDVNGFGNICLEAEKQYLETSGELCDMRAFCGGLLREEGLRQSLERSSRVRVMVQLRHGYLFHAIHDKQMLVIHNFYSCSDNF